MTALDALLDELQYCTRRYVSAGMTDAYDTEAEFKAKAAETRAAILATFAAERLAGREEVAAWHEAENERLQALGEAAEGKIGVALLNRAGEHAAAAFHIRNIMDAGHG
jgi:hypothetical protein